LFSESSSSTGIVLAWPMFGAPGGFGAPNAFGAQAPLGMGLGQPDPQALAQAQCMEVKRQMEELYPILQRASHQGGPVNPFMSAMYGPLQQGFVAYTYSLTENQQQQAGNFQFNQAMHVDYNKWLHAVQNNPDPRICHPEPLVGIPALKNRINYQVVAVEKSKQALEQLKTGMSNLKDSLQAQSLQKLEECRQRHQKLSRQLLQVVALIETFAVHNDGARRNPHMEAHLEERFARLEDAVQAPGSARPRIEELGVVLRGLLQRGPPPGGAAELTKDEANKTLRITGAQGELLERLQEDLAQKKVDIVQFENALARSAAAPIQPQMLH